VDSEQAAATIRFTSIGKEASHVNHRPPPRPTTPMPECATRVPLEQLWTQLPATRRQELLSQLTRLVAQRLAPPDSKEVADE
jgi:hypothetical protein